MSKKNTTTKTEKTNKIIGVSIEEYLNMYASLLWPLVDVFNICLLDVFHPFTTQNDFNYYELKQKF